jgi:hypothetical protein
MSVPVACIFPHSEFKDEAELQDWLNHELFEEEKGRYLLRKIRFRDKDFINRIIPGSLVLFRKGRNVVGEGITSTPIKVLNPPINSVTEDGIPMTYYNEVYFEKICSYIMPITIIEQWLNRILRPRYYLILSERSVFEKAFPSRC